MYVKYNKTIQYVHDRAFLVYGSDSYLHGCPLSDTPLTWILSKVNKTNQNNIHLWCLSSSNKSGSYLDGRTSLPCGTHVSSRLFNTSI